MFGLSLTHLILLGLFALIFIGPDDLPKVARSLGRFLNELRRGSESLKEEFRKSTLDVEKEVRGNLEVNLQIEEPKATEVAQENHPKEEPKQNG